MIFLNILEIGKLYSNSLISSSFFSVLCPVRKNDKLDTIYHIIYRFMKQHYLTVRANTHIDQALPKESYERMMLYLRNIIRLRRDNNISDPYLI